MMLFLLLNVIHRWQRNGGATCRLLNGCAASLSPAAWSQNLKQTSAPQPDVTSNQSSPLPQSSTNPPNVVLLLIIQICSHQRPFSLLLSLSVSTSRFALKGADWLTAEKPSARLPPPRGGMQGCRCCVTSLFLWLLPAGLVLLLVKPADVWFTRERGRTPAEVPLRPEPRENLWRSAPVLERPADPASVTGWFTGCLWVNRL